MLSTVGRVFFAIGVIAWGLQHLVLGDFVTRVVPRWPDGLPARTVSAYIIGIVVVAAGAAMLSRRYAPLGARVFAGITFVAFMLLHLPTAVASPAWSGAWTVAGKGLVMWSGALCLALANPGTTTLARLCLGAFMVLAGIQHFLFTPFVASLIPAWIPGAVLWTYVAGVALIWGGIGLSIPRLARLAALLSGAMIFSWVFLVHIPLVLGRGRDANNVAAVFEALAFSGVAFILAARSSTARRSPRV